MKNNTSKNIRKGLKSLVPPIFFIVIRKVGNKYFSESKAPSWNTIKSGLLAGKQIFINENGAWKDMLSGTYDKNIYESVPKESLLGKTIFDVGAHIGYSSIYFAEIVGKKGQVLAFEPNTYNKERFEKNLKENTELAKRIDIRNIAVSDKKGETEFIFSSEVDNGPSSGSFIDNAHTFWEKSIYEKKIGFTRVKVNTDSIDGIVESSKTKPYLIKIDVEGAEYLVIEGAKKTLSTIRPILLIEIHSIFNMLKVCQSLESLQYKIHLIHEEKDGRCFIKANPK